MPVIGITVPAISAPATRILSGCGDLSVAEQARGQGKFDINGLFKSLLGFALGGMLPGPISSLISNQSLLPQQLPGVGAMLGAAAMLTDPKSAPSNLTGLWGFVSGNAQSECASIAGSMASPLSNFQQVMTLMPAAVVSRDSLENVRRASDAIKGGASPTDPQIRAEILSACFTLGPQSGTIFAAYDAATALQDVAVTLQTPFAASARVLGAAANAAATVHQLGNAGLNQQFTQAGAFGMSLTLDQISSLLNLSPASLNMCGPDSLRAAGVMRQVCQAADLFLSEAGFGSMDWNSMTRDLADAIVSSSISSIARNAAQFAAIDAQGAVSQINLTVDSFLAHALCHGGSDNLTNAFTDKFGQSVGGVLTGAASVATIYASVTGLTQNFQNTLSFMESMGSTSGINSMIAGDLKGLFGLSSSKVSNEEISKLRQLRDCLQQNKADPQLISLADAQLRKAESRANTQWGMKIAVGDAAGYFDEAQKSEKAKNQINNDVLKNKTATI